MQTMYDVQQLLKRFGTIIYTGDRGADIDLMEEEIRQLYEMKLIAPKEYQMALLLLRREASVQRDKKNFL
ncbi:YqgQ family protein [Metabacillus fastidiosus]|uniref:YqgQ family protein n=1 Tax=Metabacillus fastidiosus TaxID=1458 RepID=UPI002DBBC7D3|nr:YqgQ family protein [Metabacillus fastidiosus]MEC2076566.1 YqgQ family protein [Metabacillus fastidiosus]